MSQRTEQVFLDLIAGRRKGLGATAARGGLALAEPIYAGLMRTRNGLFDRGIKSSHRAARQVVSVGNITTGGTGKTPVVHWLVERLASAGRRPAVLMRGYKAAAGGAGDEQAMLGELFREGPAAGAVVHANPDRVAGAAEIVRDHPEVDVIVLDDGLQHRRLRRDFDLVLIDATNPFGFGHVIPRGLLREPLSGLARADAFVITRSDRAEASVLGDIEKTIRIHHPAAPIYHASHVLDGFTSGTNAESISLEAFSRRNVFAFCGIGNPDSFFALLRSTGGNLVGTETFPDHHTYTSADLERMMPVAVRAKADAVVTTEKDWVKVASLIDSGGSQLPIFRTRLRIGFAEGAGNALMATIGSRLDSSQI